MPTVATPSFADALAAAHSQGVRVPVLLLLARDVPPARQVWRAIRNGKPPATALLGVAPARACRLLRRYCGAGGEAAAAVLERRTHGRTECWVVALMPERLLVQRYVVGASEPAWCCDYDGSPSTWEDSDGH